jgi:hypothetical protein
MIYRIMELLPNSFAFSMNLSPDNLSYFFFANVIFFNW